MSSMRKEPIHSIEQIRQVLRYDPETGLLYWLVNRKRNVKKAGDVAGLPRKSGYPMVWIDNHPYLVHRIAFALMTGAWPQVVDHIDGDPNNNRWDNLRECYGSKLNNGNMKLGKRNTSGWKGVSPVKSSGKWMAQIQVDGKAIYLGTFDDVREAAEEYIFAALEHFGEHVRAY